MGAADVRTWAFNPPGGLVSRNLNRVLDTFCTSLVVGKDAVSRGTVNNLSRLMDEMVTALARCRLAASSTCPAGSFPYLRFSSTLHPETHIQKGSLFCLCRSIAVLQMMP